MINDKLRRKIDQTINGESQLERLRAATHRKREAPSAPPDVAQILCEQSGHREE
jgi:hypothetical protein